METEQCGTLARQWVRCGRPSCRCARGELHGPYWYHFTREGGRLRKRYVKPGDLADVRAGIEARRRRKAETTFSRAALREAWAYLRRHGW